MSEGATGTRAGNAAEGTSSSGTRKASPKNKWTLEEHQRLTEIVERLSAESPTQPESASNKEGAISAAQVHNRSRQMERRGGRDGQRKDEPGSKKGVWSNEEENQLAALHAQHGHAWSVYTSNEILQHRSESAIKGHWHSLMRSKGLTGRPPTVLTAYIALVRAGRPGGDEALALAQRLVDLATTWAPSEGENTHATRAPADLASALDAALTRELLGLDHDPDEVVAGVKAVMAKGTGAAPTAAARQPRRESRRGASAAVQVDARGESAASRTAADAVAAVLAAAATSLPAQPAGMLGGESTSASLDTKSGSLGVGSPGEGPSAPAPGSKHHQPTQTTDTSPAGARPERPAPTSPFSLHTAMNSFRQRLRLECPDAAEKPDVISALSPIVVNLADPTRCPAPMECGSPVPQPIAKQATTQGSQVVFPCSPCRAHGAGMQGGASAGLQVSPFVGFTPTGSKTTATDDMEHDAGHAGAPSGQVHQLPGSTTVQVDGLGTPMQGPTVNRLHTWMAQGFGAMDVGRATAPQNTMAPPPRAMSDVTGLRVVTTPAGSAVPPDTPPQIRFGEPVYPTMPPLSLPSQTSYASGVSGSSAAIEQLSFSSDGLSVRVGTRQGSGPGFARSQSLGQKVAASSPSRRLRRARTIGQPEIKPSSADNPSLFSQRRSSFDRPAPEPGSDSALNSMAGPATTRQQRRSAFLGDPMDTGGDLLGESEASRSPQPNRIPGTPFDMDHDTPRDSPSSEPSCRDSIASWSQHTKIHLACLSNDQEPGMTSAVMDIKAPLPRSGSLASQGSPLKRPAASALHGTADGSPQAGKHARAAWEGAPWSGPASQTSIAASAGSGVLPAPLSSQTAGTAAPPSDVTPDASLFRRLLRCTSEPGGARPPEASGADGGLSRAATDSEYGSHTQDGFFKPKPSTHVLTAGTWRSEQARSGPAQDGTPVRTPPKALSPPPNPLSRTPSSRSDTPRSLSTMREGSPSHEPVLITPQRTARSPRNREASHSPTPETVTEKMRFLAAAGLIPNPSPDKGVVGVQGLRVLGASGAAGAGLQQPAAPSAAARDAQAWDPAQQVQLLLSAHRTSSGMVRLEDIGQGSPAAAAAAAAIAAAAVAPASQPQSGTSPPATARSVAAAAAAATADGSGGLTAHVSSAARDSRSGGPEPARAGSVQRQDQQQVELSLLTETAGNAAWPLPAADSAAGPAPAYAPWKAGPDQDADDGTLVVLNFLHSSAGELSLDDLINALKD